jgi:peptide-methionine (R)-S-oxide reductase
MPDTPKTEAEWQKVLTPEQFAICRCSATEAPFTGKYWDCHEQGLYHCIACGQVLFSSAAKYDSGSGWPSYYQVASPDAVIEVFDESHGMRRVEVQCAGCRSHLGHVFTDGPKPSGLRYCINSAALDLKI